ncbi:hypothetical protein [Phytohabitans houttuyneae]|uniref:Uncharacterized protein n=1 Tax=Phytohabitans houttuyneae TaxID=1076126 RepID=A0A6V8KTZ5_9ACTN|nr:hypothetical protein [Phytohabitans houttuyneae]GFJ85791.1 hypothetical protein Phou_099710 [Phytohabitans houttuyneae]
MSGRGTTGRGRGAVMPDSIYAASVELATTGTDVVFAGEDGRTATFAFDRLPLSGWHEPLAASLRRLVGPAGGRRTRSSAEDVWGTALRFLRFLATLDKPPALPGEVRAEHLEQFLARQVRGDERNRWRQIRNLAMLLEPLRETIAQEVLDFTGQRKPVQERALPGYSDGELDRLLTAARCQVAGIRDRIAAGEALLADLHADRIAHSETVRELATMAGSGVVPHRPGLRTAGERLALAQRLFLTRSDVIPLLVLLVGVTGRNIETIKELPAEHRVLDGQAVELRVVKRRRGPGNWTSSVTWEIGPPHRQLHTPGGLYLLLHRLTARSRSFSDTPSAWPIWRHGRQAHVDGVAEHFDPFARELDGLRFKNTRWVAEQGLLADPGPDGEPRRFPLSFPRLRTSIEVRRTKQMGGHLPSAARTNTFPVLFRHYLRGDPIVTSWAEDVVGEALVDAEQAALAAHERALRTTGGRLRVVGGPVDPGAIEHDAGLDPDRAQAAAAGHLDTGWSACVDHDAHPATGRACQSTFLDCFHCGNCLITRDHLPRLLALLDALDERRQQISEQNWWDRYGPAWLAIRHDVLTRFTPDEVEAAARAKPVDALLDLIENPWEKP